MEPADVSMRVIADHARAMTFLIADGVVPSNEWRGYVLRKIMRRAMRHGNKLGLTEPFLYRLVDVLVEQMGDAYPELRTGHDYVAKVVRGRGGALRGGAQRPACPASKTCSTSRPPPGVVPGDDVFRLYDSYGLPVDFIEDTAAQRGLDARPRGIRARHGGAARARAGQQRVRRRRRRPSTSPRARPRGPLWSGRRPVRRLHRRPECRACRSSRSSTRTGAEAAALAAGAAGFRRARAGRRSTSSRAARSPTPAALRAETGRLGAASTAASKAARLAAAAPGQGRHGHAASRATS